MSPVSKSPRQTTEARAAVERQSRPIRATKMRFKAGPFSNRCVAARRVKETTGSWGLFPKSARPPATSADEVWIWPTRGAFDDFPFRRNCPRSDRAPAEGAGRFRRSLPGRACEQATGPYRLRRRAPLQVRHGEEAG